MKTIFYKSTFSSSVFSLGFFMLVLFFSWNGMAQTQNNGNGKIALKGAKEIQLSAVTGTPTYVSFNENERPSFTNFEKWLQTNLDLSVDFEIQLINSDRDAIGFTHYRYIQTYKGIPVNRTMILVHVQNNAVASFNGEMISKISGGTIPTVTPEVALSNAKKFTGAKSYKWEIPGEEAFIKKEQGDVNATFYPKAELLFAKSSNGEYRLAYRFDIYAQQPVSRNYVFVDAVTGEVLDSETRIFEIDTPGTAITGYSGTQTITTSNQFGIFYILRETGRGLGIETYNMNLDTSYAAATDFTDDDNSWNNVNAAKDQYATDAHFGAEKTYDYYFNTYGRNSLDNAGLKLLGYVHANLVGFGYNNNINAFWDGSRMNYGDGGVGYNPLTAMDIVAHEITHGLTEHTANIIYKYEGGALHEGFSDIFGTTVEFYATPGQADWTMAEDVGTPFRNMSNPNQYTQPDTYRGNYWYYGQGDAGGAHANDGVLNYWYYLLTQGGSGTNDIGSAYTVSGIGMTKAAAIAYRTLTVYLFPSAQYADARFYAIKSAEDLYGVCSLEAIATAAAWYAVGVGDLVTGSAPTISTGGITGFCSGSSQQINASPAANYQWNKNNVAIAGATNSSYAATTSAFYTVTTNYCSIAYTSSSIYLTAYNPQVTISSSTTSSCNGNSILLSSTSSSGYQIQWNKNGVAIAGATNATYSAAVSGNYTATISGTTIPASMFSNAGAIPIPNYTCTGVNDAIAVSGLPASISSSGISVMLNITHPHDSDLIIWLEAPNGDKLGLAYMNGGTSGANYTNTAFSDAAFNQLPLNTGAPYTGTFRAMPSTFAICGANTMTKTSFTGIGYGAINPNGNWKLHIVDIRPTNLGTLNSWSISFRSIQTPNPNCGPVTSNQISLSIINAVAPIITPSGATTFCQGGSVTLSSSVANAYLWSTAATTQSILVSASGNYAVTVSTGVGCITSSVPTTVTVNPLPAASVISAGGSTTFCSGGSVLLSGNSTSGIWSVGGANTTTLLATTSGDYFVTNSNSCGSTSSNHIAVTVNTLPSASVISSGGATTFCSGGNVLLSGNSTVGTWSVGGGSTATLLATISGDYFVTTSNSCGSTTSNHIAVTVNPLPAISFNGLGITYSVSASPVTLTGLPVGGTFSGVGISGNTFSPAVAGAGGPYSISYFYTDLNGCSNSSTQQTTVTNCTLPTQPSTITVTGGAAKVCPGDLRTYTVTLVAGVTYNWTAPTGAVITSGQGTRTINVSYNNNFTASGVISVLKNNSCGNSVPRTLTISLNTPTTPSAIVGLSAGVCANTTHDYSVTLVSGMTYNWIGSSNMTIPVGQGTNAVTINFDNAFASGSIYVNANNACGAGPYRALSIASVPSTPGTMTGATYGLCGQTNVQYSVPNVAGLTYTWTVPSGAIILSGQGTNIITVNFINSVASGTVSVIASNACGNSVARSVTVRKTPATPGTITGANTVCSNQFGVPYSIGAVPTATTYTWTAPTGAHVSDGVTTSVANILTTASTSVTVNYGSSAGFLYAKATNSCGTGSNKSLAITMNCKEEENNLFNATAMIVYPNPTDGFVHVSISASTDGNGLIQLTDISGRILQSQNISFAKGENNLNLDLTEYAQGIYLVQFTSNSVSQLVKVAKE